ncbi:hypothetical protein [Evansella tamaricis]|uniref:Uncharacterized protein n=1 Tax=Evansella tamaricis TaxID=2069301 RepID=A0ABS6JJ68_9BACI|nr:hypothetical protein [Evansella tamaricis]MBU9712373.1 hypothetical protein [Evansella tamaricis]
MPVQDYKWLSEQELLNHYLNVRQYMEKGFRAEGLKEELELILHEFEHRKMEVVKNKEVYLEEILDYIRTIRL